MATVKNNLAATTDPTAADDLSIGYAVGSRWWNNATMVQHICTDATTGAASWQSLERPQSWPSAAYRYPEYIVGLTDGQPVADTFYAVPFIAGRKRNIDAIAVHLVTAQSGAAARMGIYRHSTTTELPGSLYLDAGVVDLSGATGLKPLTINTSIRPGMWWLAILFNSPGTQPTVKRVSSCTLGVFPGGGGDVTASNPWRGVSGSQAYGALPSYAPTTTATNGFAPVLGLRAS